MPSFSVDRRPMWRIVADKLLQPAALALAASALIYTLVTSTPEGLTVEAWRAIGVFGCCVILWTTQALPLAVTALIALAALPLSGVLPAAQVYKDFSHSAVFFLITAFVLAAAVRETGLSTRVAVFLLNRFGRNPRSFFQTVLLSCAFFSLWMPEHAVAAMMYPVLQDVREALPKDRSYRRYGGMLFLAMAWGCVAGGVGTLLGGGRAPLALSLLEKSTGIRLSFLDYMLAALPTSATAIFLATFVGMRVARPWPDSIEVIRPVLERRIKLLGPMGRAEKGATVISFLTICAWITVGEHLGLAPVGMIGATAMFVFRIVTWEQVERSVSWGIVMLYGGAVAVAAALNSTGATLWLASDLLGHITAGPVWTLLGISLLSLVLTEWMSNSAVVALLMPVAMGVAAKLSLDPVAVTYAIAVPAGLAFALPMGTPALALAYGAGDLRMRETLPLALVLNFTCLTILWAWAYLLWPMLGIHLP